MSDVLTEICKVEPTFEKEVFLKMCEKEIIPNVLEVGRLSYVKVYFYTICICDLR